MILPRPRTGYLSISASTTMSESNSTVNEVVAALGHTADEAAVVAVVAVEEAKVVDEEAAGAVATTIGTTTGTPTIIERLSAEST
mmetsp:Transcript_17795/g.51208  ORF Transcript_17795/g.51208 Transcript_17795/m.51208 type:complete len:85 (+) Transcript_17795:803-1057(+)